MTTLDRLVDLLKGRPEEVSEKMRRVGLGRARELRRESRFEDDYLPDWYELMREVYGILVNHEPLPNGVKRRHLFYITNAARDGMEDNLTPIKALDSATDEERPTSTVGPLNQVIQFNKYTTLNDDGIIEVVPLSPDYKMPMEDKKFTTTVKIDRSVNAGDERVTDIQWQMDYRIMKEAFGEIDYEGTLIEPERTLWLRVGFLRKDLPEIAYRGRPERMA